MTFRKIIHACCTPIYSEILKSRVAVLGVAAVAAAQVSSSMIFGLGIPCTFHAVTGQPCPGCGLTRSVMSLLRGHVGESFLYHPFGPPLLAAAILALVIATLPRLLRERTVQKIATLESRLGGMSIMLLLFFLLWGLRLMQVVPLTNLAKS
jgi:hypothetical protein